LRCACVEVKKESIFNWNGKICNCFVEKQGNKLIKEEEYIRLVFVISQKTPF